MTLDRRTRRDRRNLVPTPPPISAAFTQACADLERVWPNTAPRSSIDADETPSENESDPFDVLNAPGVLDALCACADAMRAAQALEHTRDAVDNEERQSATDEYFHEHNLPRAAQIGRGKSGVTVADATAELLRGTTYRDLRKRGDVSPNNLLVARDSTIAVCVAEGVKIPPSVLASLGPSRGFGPQHLSDERQALVERHGIKLHALARFNDSHRLLARRLPPAVYQVK